MDLYYFNKHLEYKTKYTNAKSGIKNTILFDNYQLNSINQFTSKLSDIDDVLFCDENMTKPIIEILEILLECCQTLSKKVTINYNNRVKEFYFARPYQNSTLRLNVAEMEQNQDNIEQNKIFFSCDLMQDTDKLLSLKIEFENYFDIGTGNQVKDMSTIYTVDNEITEAAALFSIIFNKCKMIPTALNNLYDLPNGIFINVGRFGNIMFPIVHYLCAILNKRDDFVLGLSFLKNYIKMGQSVYFGPDIYDYDTNINEYYNKYNLESLRPYTRDPFRLYFDIDQESYILKYRQDVIKFFGFYIKSKNPKLDELIIDREFVALHFRGSDFCVTQQNERGSDFYVLHFKYYYNILQQNKDLQHRTIVLFYHPDDDNIIDMMIVYLGYFFPNCKFIKESQFIEKSHVHIAKQLELIYLISKFSTIILSNSSFSFWAGYLASPNISSKIYGIFEYNFAIPRPYRILMQQCLTLSTVNQSWINIKNVGSLFSCYYQYRGENLSHFELFLLIHAAYYNTVLTVDNIRTSLKTFYKDKGKSVGSKTAGILYDLYNNTKNDGNILDNRIDNIRKYKQNSEIVKLIDMLIM